VGSFGPINFCNILPVPNSWRFGNTLDDICISVKLKI
jgi:hypothetical protein